MSMFPRDPFGFDFSLRGSLFGMDVVTSQDIPRYTLPAEVMPGIPWPDGFRDDLNRWSRDFCGTTNMLKPGQFYVMADRYIMARPDDIVKLSALCA